MEQNIPDNSDSVKLMAAIGNVCIQWSRLEMILLGIIYVIEDIPLEKGELVFSGLDIGPRMNMAIKLAEYAKVPSKFQRRLIKARDCLQKKVCGGGQLIERRNQAVHGAYTDIEQGASSVTMVRLRGPRRSEKLTPVELAELGREIHELGNECWQLALDIGQWKFPDHNFENYQR